MRKRSYIDVPRRGAEEPEPSASGNGMSQGGRNKHLFVVIQQNYIMIIMNCMKALSPSSGASVPERPMLPNGCYPFILIFS